jgi:hypothetical protein
MGVTPTVRDSTVTRLQVVLKCRRGYVDNRLVPGDQGTPSIR